MVPRRAKLARDVSISASAPSVLVVDDEPGVRSFLQKALILNGFQVWMAGDGKTAIEIYESHRDCFAVILMDVCMPGMDGPATLAALRSIDPGVRCCFMTGGGGYSREDLLAGGASHVLGKPFSLAEVVRVLHQLVSDSRSRVA
ncbi:MAG TPA: response regulator [Gemmataceae bacterium]|jgi:CheY-like chemotaxis protein|nr:response regulator [Gemmataceae bacterium]